MHEYRHPKSIRGRRRWYQRVFEAEDRGRRIHGETMRHHVPMGRELLAAVLPLPAIILDD